MSQVLLPYLQLVRNINFIQFENIKLSMPNNILYSQFVQYSVFLISDEISAQPTQPHLMQVPHFLQRIALGMMG